MMSEKVGEGATLPAGFVRWPSAELNRLLVY